MMRPNIPLPNRLTAKAVDFFSKGVLLALSLYTTSRMGRRGKVVTKTGRTSNSSGKAADRG